MLYFWTKDCYLYFCLSIISLWECTHVPIKSNWECNGCLMPRKQFFSYIMTRTICFLKKWWWCLVCTSNKNVDIKFSVPTINKTYLILSYLSYLMACFRNDLHQVLSNKKIGMTNILKHAMLDIYSASSLKQQSKDRHISQLSQIMFCFFVFFNSAIFNILYRMMKKSSYIHRK